MFTSAARWLLRLLLCALASPAFAAVGFIELPASQAAGRVSVFYPTQQAAQPVRRGDLQFVLAVDAAPARGNGRLVVISPGSGASPWMYFDLSAELVAQGFVVAMPEHAGDNYRDYSAPGPASWKLRPFEVSRAIDRVGADPRFQPLLDLAKVGMYGMSAGGHTALTLAGGRWSPSRLRQHCDAHIAQDFQACAGLTTQLTGGLLDGLKRTAVKWVIDFKFRDTTWYAHTDPRIAAIIAGVPFAADFDPASLRTPVVPLGLISARQDRWLNPAYHVDVIRQACTTCERVADIQHGGHGALLSPLPPELSGLLATLVADPPGFDRATEVPAIDRRIADFFRRHLLP